MKKLFLLFLGWFIKKPVQEQDSVRVFQFKDRENGMKRLEVYMIEGKPWFLAIDVCDMLGLKNPSATISCLDDYEKRKITIRGKDQRREKNLINESGLYFIVIRSRKPVAKEIRKWITSTVLPSVGR